MTIITENGKTLFCGSDVAKALGYKKPQNAIAAHCRGALKRGIPTNGKFRSLDFFIQSTYVDVVGSREVAKLTGRNHKDLLRDIRGYIEVMEKSIERNFAPRACLKNKYCTNCGLVQK